MNKRFVRLFQAAGRKTDDMLERRGNYEVIV